jgi:hypothetical protein
LHCRRFQSKINGLNRLLGLWVDIHWGLLSYLLDSAAVCCRFFPIVDKFELLSYLAAQTSLKAHWTLGARRVSYQLQRVDELSELWGLYCELASLLFGEQRPINELQSEFLNKIVFTDLGGITKLLGDTKTV